MVGAYSQDLRWRVLAAAHEGQHSSGALAAPVVAGPARRALRDLVAAHPAGALAEPADGLRAASGRRPSVSTVCRARRRLDLRRKKIGATGRVDADVRPHHGAVISPPERLPAMREGTPRCP